ncbi:MAG: hypothetical protein K2Y39_00135 [Candidatus Obscuribacterales bacterium]|nr:hypothetical protein [Candidatus Obscuribacterales bacterium]
MPRLSQFGFYEARNVMGDRELVERAENNKKSVDTCAALSREVESAQFSNLRPMSVSSTNESDILDFKESESIQAKLQAIAAQKKCSTLGAGRGFSIGNSAYEAEPGGTHIGHVAPDHVFSYDPYQSSTRMTVRTAESQPLLTCPGHLDFEKDDVWGKKIFDKKLIGDKLSKKDVDFAPVNTLYPVASQLFDSVDRNRDGTMSNREITRALSRQELNDKEKGMLEIIKKNNDSIDNDGNGISMREIKEFDAKVVEYNRELSMVRKFAPETSEFARALHLRGKSVDDNHDGKFSREELQNFYVECKKDFLSKPTEEGKRELQALGWGLAHYDRFALLTGRPGGGQITIQSVRSQAFRELDRGMPREFQENFLSTSDRHRVERYQQSS